jgi:hypothetical protein
MSDQEHGLVPSGSTSGSMLAGAIATLVVVGFHMKGIDFPAGVEAALAVIFTALGGYLPKSGRRAR